MWVFFFWVVSFLVHWLFLLLLFFWMSYDFGLKFSNPPTHPTTTKKDKILFVRQCRVKINSQPPQPPLRKQADSQSCHTHLFPSAEEGIVLFVLVDGRARVTQAAQESLLFWVILLTLLSGPVLSLSPHHKPLLFLVWVLLRWLAKLVQRGDRVWALRWSQVHFNSWDVFTCHRRLAPGLRVYQWQRQKFGTRIHLCLVCSSIQSQS